MEWQKLKSAWGIHKLDQLGARSQEHVITVTELLEQHGTVALPHEQFNPQKFAVCPYSREIFHCPLDKRFECIGLSCTYWLHNEGKK